MSAGRDISARRQAHVTRFASLASSQRPSGSLRKIVNVKPERRTGVPPAGVMVISMKLRS